MKISKLGPISKSDLTLNDLTILTGQNNQGKTYMSYAIYGILKAFEDVSMNFYSYEEANNFNEQGVLTISIEDFKNRIIKTFKEKISDEWTQILQSNFQTDESTFFNSKLIITEQDINSLFEKNFNNKKFYKNTVKYGHRTVSLSKDEQELKFLQLVENDITKTKDNNIDNYFITFTIMIHLTESFIKSSISAFYIPAERVGLNVFRSQLNSNKIQILDTLTQHLTTTENKYFLENPISEVKPYLAKPINDYLKFINGINKYDIDDSDSSLGRFIREKIVKGRFDVDKSSDKSYFRPRHSAKRYKKEIIPLHITSSSVKSFYGLDYYLENLDLENTTNFLIIDEPEMNLHPSAQVEFVNFIDLLLTNNIKIIISTHSDFFIKKIQNIALLNKNNPKHSGMGIQESNTSLYNFSDNTTKKVNLLSNDDYTNFSQTFYDLEEEFFEAIEAKEEVQSEQNNDSNNAKHNEN